MKKNIKIIKEEKVDLGERTLTEKGLANIIKKRIDFNNITDNFYDVVVDIYGNKYGEYCQINILMKKPFPKEVADQIHELKRGINKLVLSLIPDRFNAGISTSTLTLDVYKEKHIPYYNHIKKKDVIDEDIKRIKEVMGILTEDDKSMSKVRRRLSDLDGMISRKIDLKLIQGEHIPQFCKTFTPESYVDTVIEDVIQQLYYSVFFNMDDTSKDWFQVYDYLEVKLVEEYLDKIKNAYIEKCKNVYTRDF